MIDFESELFSDAKAYIRKLHPKTFVTGEYVRMPSSFPAVSIIEMSNTAFRRTQTTDCGENHAEVMYEVNTYSNLRSGKKTQCKQIAADVDRFMTEAGFTRMMMNPVPNMDDATIYRILARYRAVVSKNNTVYRR